MFDLKRARRHGIAARFFLLTAAGAWCGGCLHRDPPADLTIINQAEPESLDPQIITSQAAMRLLRGGLFEGLMRLDPRTARAIPSLAERYEISPDGLTYTFHLRPNLAWSTGEPMLAEEVVYSWRRALDPATAADYAGQLYCLKHGEDYNTGRITDPAQVGVRALDDRTVRVELNQPTAYFIELCAFPTLEVVPRRTIEKYGDAWIKARPLPSSGPYELVCWRLNDKVRLRKNPRYWDAANTRSELIDFLPITSPATAFNLYAQGRADIILDKELMPADLLEVLKRQPDFHTFNYLGTYFFRINVTRRPFDDVRVRRALALAVDRERIVKKITRGGEPVTTSLVPAGTANYHPVPGLDYNPAEARKLLAEAGYPGGRGFPHFEYQFNASAAGAAKVHENIAVELQQMWRDNLGLNLELHQVESKVYQSAQKQLDYYLSRSSWIGDYNDAQSFLGLFTSNDGNNRTGWKSARYDALIRAAGAELDLAAREKIFQTAETLLVHDEVPIVPIYTYAGMSYYNTNRIRGLYPNLLDDHPLQTLEKIPPPK